MEDEIKELQRQLREMNGQLFEMRSRLDNLNKMVETMLSAHSGKYSGSIADMVAIALIIWFFFVR